MASSEGPVVLENDKLRVTVSPMVGGTIDAILHKPSGVSILGTVPWTKSPSPLESGAAPDEPVWLTRYGGGWPILFPNGGDACVFEGVFHGFHGEASITAWEAALEGGVLRLSRRFDSVPVEMTRHIAIEGEVLTVRENLRMLGAQAIRVMWGHHPTFGSDLLAGPFEIRTGARRVTTEATYDPSANPLIPGAEGQWSSIPGKTGPYDLGRPQEPMAALAYLSDFAEPWASIRRLDNAVAAVLSWDKQVFPCAWAWFELAGTPDEPWRGRTRLIGLEPNTTWPGTGLAEAERRGGQLLTLQPGMEMETTVRLCAFRPEGPVRGVDAEARGVSA